MKEHVCWLQTEEDRAVQAHPFSRKLHSIETYIPLELIIIDHTFHKNCFRAIFTRIHMARELACLLLHTHTHTRRAFCLKLVRIWFFHKHWHTFYIFVLFSAQNSLPVISCARSRIAGFRKDPHPIPSGAEL